MLTLDDALKKRRSTRAFTDRPVSRAEVGTLLEAAILAPSACNMQSWHFYAVMDSSVRAAFGEVCASWACTAPVIFVICADQTALREKFGGRWGDDRLRTFVIQDTALAAENLLLKAADMGLGGCFMGAFDAAKCREVLSIPEKYEIVALIPVGEPAEEIPPKERKPLAEVADIIGGDDPTCDADDEEQSDCGEPLVICDRGDLAGTVLMNNNMPGAVLMNNNMPGAVLKSNSMPGVVFNEGELTGAVFNEADLNGAVFNNNELGGAVFAENDLDGAVFKNCSFRNVRFEGCEFDAVIVDKDGTETKLK